MVRRYLRAMVTAILLAMAIGVVAPRVMDVPIPSICDSLDPDGFWFWWWGCKTSAGGGGSGAGMD